VPRVKSTCLNSETKWGYEPTLARIGARAIVSVTLCAGSGEREVGARKSKARLNGFPLFISDFKFEICGRSPVLFIADDGGKAYVVLTLKNGVPLPPKVLDQLGIPGLVVRGKTLRAHGIDALAIASGGS
jgi:hypothetical protein